MAEPINLNRARKARDKAQDRTRAAENRVRFGREKTGKQIARLEREKAARALDGKKLED
jgi:hypothetical protein